MTKSPRSFVDPAILTNMRAILADTEGLRAADDKLSDVERAALRESMQRLEAGDWSYLNRIGPPTCSTSR